MGVITPLTGDLSPFGGPGAKAADLAAAQVNAAAEAGDSGLSMTLVTEDEKTDPQASQEAATKLIESDGVSAIAGPWGTPDLIPTAENVTIPAGVPIVTPSATGPDLTSLDDDGLVFRTPPSDAIQGRVIAQIMADAIGADATVNTGNRNDSYGTALVVRVHHRLGGGGRDGRQERPVQPRGREPQLRGPADRRRQPRRLDDHRLPRHLGEDGPGAGEDRQLGPRQDVHRRRPEVGRPSPVRRARSRTEGMRGSAPTSLEAPAGAQFDALWKSDVGDPRQTYDAQNFDAVILIALAAAAAGSSDPAAIAENLQAVSGPPGDKYTFEDLQAAIDAAANGDDIDYEGASGPIDLDDNGDPSAANYGTWSYKGGKLVDTTEVIPVTE